MPDEEMWPVLWPSHTKKGQFTEEEVGFAEDLAVSSLRALTLQRVGIIRLRARPAPGGWLSTWERYSHAYAGFVPSSSDLKDGIYWHGMVPARQRLVAPVAKINSITIGGDVVDPSEYTVLEGSYLVRADGSHWPASSGSMIVDYYTGHSAGIAAQMAAGLLAEEFLSAMATGECQLPSGITEYTRSGVSITVDAGLFPGGMTGITEVDAFIRVWNPHGLITRPAVYSPDLDGPVGSGGRW